MFQQRFGRKPLAGLSRNVTQNENEQSRNKNRIPALGNSRAVRQPYVQERNHEQQDSINSIQDQQSTLTRKSQENTRLGKYGYNRRSYSNASWRRQPTVHQADNTQAVKAKSLARNANNKQINLQPAVIGTNAFQTQSKPAQESPSPRNQATNNQRRLSNVSEQPSELSSSFCYINQGNLPKAATDNFKQSEILAFTPEPNITVTDYCAYCLSKQKFHEATHHCGNCGPFGRYMCQRCLGPHNDFTENHNVKSLSGQSYRNQKAEASESAEILCHEKTHPKFIKDISVKTEEDEQSCQITGFCQLQNGTIVLTEMNNKAIKTLDCQTYQVMSRTQLLNYPMDICCIDDKVALVILYKSTIQYVTIDGDNEVQLTRKQELKHDCLCLAVCNRKIFLGSSKSLYIYDENWTELDNITNHLFGDEWIFSDQFSIAVSMHDNVTTIYVADENTGMYAIELTGHDLTTTWKFKDCNSFKASGLCFDGDENVLLSDRGSERLIKMNAEGMILAILLDSGSGIQPLNLPFYNKKNNELILSLSGKDIIKVFDFK